MSFGSLLNSQFIQVTTPRLFNNNLSISIDTCLVFSKPFLSGDSVLFFAYLYITLTKSSSKYPCYESEITKVLLSVRSSEKDSKYCFTCTVHEVSDVITPGVSQQNGQW